MPDPERVRQLEALVEKMPDPERVRQLEAKLRAMPDPDYVRKLEADVRRLSTQVERLSTRQAVTGPARPPARGGAGPGGSGAGEEVVGGATISPSAEAPSPRFDMPAPIPDLPARVRFGPGFEIKTGDDEFSLQFHDLTQVDGRFYQQRNQNPVADTFGLARQWLIFSGHITRPIEYYISLADAFDTFNILDVFLNVNYDKRLQFRAGRFKTPFTYEFYAEPTPALANGEWSLFFNNFGMDRGVGAMAWGESVFQRVDYAAGIFNSTPNGFVDLSDPKSLIAFFNAAPWRPAEGSALEYFNVGGSVVAGAQQHVPVPVELRTIVPTSGSTVLGVPFLTFNPNVFSSGERALWSLHMAYYYKQLSLMGEWQSGFEDFALVDHPNSRTRLPIESFYVQAAYMLTGERVASRGLVKPRRPFDLRRGRFGPGAWELAGRYSMRVLPARLPESIRLICYGGDPHPGGSRWARVCMGNCRRIWCEGSAGSRSGGDSESRGTRSLIRSGRSPSDWPRSMASVAPPPCSTSITIA